MQREWDEDPLPVELWEAIQVLRQDCAADISRLTDLAERGSTLAMMYLGRDHVLSVECAEITQGEDWLIRSARAGSIEGRLQLARHYERQEAWGKAIAELEIIAEQGYSPARYYLAHLRYKGDPAHQSLPQAISHLRMAIDAGRLPSIALLSQIYRKEKLGLRAKIASHWLCLTKIPALVRCMWNYPNSDRLRPFGRNLRE